MKVKNLIKSITPITAMTWAAIFLAAGCATNQPGLVLDAVGPAPGLASAGGSQGTLVVFSAFDSNGVTGMDRQAHTDYQILFRDGKPARKVRNDSGTMASGPTSVQLDVGSYDVVARANGYRTVTVPVVIQAGKRTIVHLDGGGSWRDREEMIRIGAVRLPDGRVVGWSSDAEAKFKP